MELGAYYKHLFPVESYTKWLSYNNKPDIYKSNKLSNTVGSYISRREISLTLPQDIYVRYQTIDPLESGKSAAETFKDLLIKRNPIKIDIGAVYNNSPKYKSSRHEMHQIKGGYVIPLEKEIVFDIDMTDYDPVRLCCSGAKICNKCWPLMRVACKILKRQLERAFGLKHLIFIYSGRRGVHCWVSDKKAREYSSAVRTTLAQYLQLLSGGGPGLPENGACERKNVRVYKSSYDQCDLYSSSLEIIDQYFEDYIRDQGFFEGENFKKLTGLITNEKPRNYLNEKIGAIPENNITGRINTFIAFFKTPSKEERSLLKSFFFAEALYEIKLQICYPRLDINVSKDVHHLLKSPFSVHPKTGNICVPIATEEIDSFDPFRDCPKLGVVVKQLNDPNNKKPNGEITTDLTKYITIFNAYVNRVCVEEDQHAADFLNQSQSECTDGKKRKVVMQNSEIVV